MSVTDTARAAPASAGRSPRVDQVGRQIDSSNSRSQAFPQFISDLLRQDSLIARQFVNQIDSIRSALNGGLITPEQAIAWRSALTVHDVVGGP